MKKPFTIISIDTQYHALTKRALEHTSALTQNENIVVLSDKDILPGSKWFPIEKISLAEYSKLVLNDLSKYIETEYFMLIQYDGIPINNLYWDNAFLEYDYIGAPWLWGTRRVGNGGFSIRSTKLSKLCENLPLLDGNSNNNEDYLICVHYADYLEKQGITFAPEELARKFSQEHPIGFGNTYGFHGGHCLPYYLPDDYMEFFIENMTNDQFLEINTHRILYGLYQAGRYDHMEHLMDRGCELLPNFKNDMLEKLVENNHNFPNLSLKEMEHILANY